MTYCQNLQSCPHSISVVMNLQRLLLAVGSGILVHLTIFIRGEWHLRVPKILVTHFLCLALATVLCNEPFHAPIFGILYVIGLFGSIGLYPHVLPPHSSLPWSQGCRTLETVARVEMQRLEEPSGDGRSILAIWAICTFR